MTREQQTNATILHHTVYHHATPPTTILQTTFYHHLPHGVLWSMPHQPLPLHAHPPPMKYYEPSKATITITIILNIIITLIQLIWHKPHGGSCVESQCCSPRCRVLALSDCRWGVVVFAQSLLKTLQYENTYLRFKWFDQRHRMDAGYKEGSNSLFGDLPPGKPGSHLMLISSFICDAGTTWS